MFGNVVLEIPKDAFEHELDAVKKARGAKLDTDLDEKALGDVVTRYKKVVKTKAGREFPQDPHEQLTMARDAVFNAASVIRAVAGIDPSDHDLHVNVVGGGNIDGPSAGLAFFLALYSALTSAPLPQDVAVTGEVSLVGNVRAIGGIVEKLYAARQAGMRAIVIPRENVREIDATPEGIEVVAVGTVAEALAALGVRVPPPPALRARPRVKASR